MDINELVSVTQTLRVLYVEDNRDARESTLGMLDSFFSDIVVGVDGEDGLDKFNNSKESFDIIITDVNMPKMNGLEMIKKIREKDNNVYIVIISAHKESGYLKESMSVGANEIMLKPIEIDKFLSMLGNLCKKI